MYKVYFSKKNCKNGLALPTKHGFNPPPELAFQFTYSSKRVGHLCFDKARNLAGQKTIFGTKSDIRDKKRYPGRYRFYVPLLSTR
jgi:hypothetical protein